VQASSCSTPATNSSSARSAQRMANTRACVCVCVCVCV
jgi:hypothetical protein